jgi:glycosyltransferase involved in cell wall biosynthesis
MNHALRMTITVVVPAWNEAPRIARVIRRLPAWVDAVVVVDDASTDATSSAAKSVGDARVEVVRHAHNRGVGAAIVTGYRHALRTPGSPRDAFVVMAGDDQMDPDDLPALLAPLERGAADYVKGDRFQGARIPPTMPLGRWIGGLAFSWATSRAIGVAISDSQCGYTAIARSACESIDLDALWPGYGYPNDLLSQIALRRLRIAHVPVRAVYADETSRLKPRHVAIVGALVMRAWARRWVDRLLTGRIR